MVRKKFGNPLVSHQKAAKGLAWDPSAQDPGFLGCLLHLNVSFGSIPSQSAPKKHEISLDSSACDEA